MKTKTLFLFTFALIVPLTASAQPATSTAPPQPAKRYSSLDDNPQFKRLSPEQQDVVRKAMQNTEKAVAEARKNGANPDGTKSGLPVWPTQAGCEATPAKKPRFHIPKAFQDAINKQAKQVSGKTGVDVDPNAPAKAVKDAQQKLPPCPPSPAAPAQPVKK